MKVDGAQRISLTAQAVHKDSNGYLYPRWDWTLAGSKSSKKPVNNKLLMKYTFRTARSEEDPTLIFGINPCDLDTAPAHRLRLCLGILDDFDDHHAT
jgi:hypothetical protein